MIQLTRVVGLFLPQLRETPPAMIHESIDLLRNSGTAMRNECHSLGIEKCHSPEKGPPIAIYVHAGPRTGRLVLPSAAELMAHEALVARLKDPVWRAP